MTSNSCRSESAAQRERRERRLARRQPALPPLALRLHIQGGEVAAVILEDVKPALPLSPTVVVDPIGRELAVDPAHDALGDHARHVAGSGPVREAVQGVERRVLRGEGGSGRRGWQGRCMLRPYEGQAGARDHETAPNDPVFHAVILTHSPLEKLRS